MRKIDGMSVTGGSGRALFAGMLLMGMLLTGALAAAMFAAPSPALAQARPADNTGELWGRVDELESYMRQLTGRIEESEHRLQQLNARIEKLIQDIDFRLTNLERATPGASLAGTAPASAPPPAGPAAGGAPPPSAAAAPPAAGRSEGVLGALPVRPGAAAPGSGPEEAPREPARAGTGPAAVAGAPRAVQLPQGSPQDRYNFAYRLLRQGDYAEAEQAFQQFLKAHPGDGLAGNAQYWLGETYYVRSNYRDAASTFLAGYQKYPKGSKAPDTLLKLGMSLTNLGQKQEACGVFQQLAREHPNAPGSVKQLAATERTRAGCR